MPLIAGAFGRFGRDAGIVMFAPPNMPIATAIDGKMLVHEKHPVPVGGIEAIKVNLSLIHISEPTRRS